MGLFDFGKVKKLERENIALKKLAADARGFQNIRLENLKNGIKQNIAVYPIWDTSQQEKRYCNTDDVFAIIKLLSTTAAMIPNYGYLITTDRKSFNQLVREQKKKDINPVRIKEFQTKGLTDLPDSDPITQLLEMPNDLQSKFEFFESIHSWLNLKGEAFLYKQRVNEGTNRGKTVQLFILHPTNVIIKVSPELPRRVVAYDYRINGQMIYENIPAEDVIHIKTWNPLMDYYGSELRGLSPLEAYRKRFTRLDSNLDVSIAQMQNGGVETIVYDKMPQDKAAIEIQGNRKDNFFRFISNAANAGAPFFATGEMGSIQLGSHLSDMGIVELANIDFKKLCNIFGVSDILFNSDSASTESNVQIHTKRLYTNTVLPNVFRVRDALIRGLLPDFRDGVTLTEIVDGEEQITKIPGDGKNRYIDADLSDITELHEDLGKKATWLLNSWWLTPNEKREMMDYEKFDNALFDEPLLPGGLQTLEDLVIEPPIDQVTESGN